MTRRIVVLASAGRDIAQTLGISREDFGPAAHAAYKALIDRSFRDLADDAARPGVRDVSEARPGVFAYHLRFSRTRVAGPRVRRPRHVVLFRLRDDTVVIARLLHERMLLSRHL